MFVQLNGFEHNLRVLKVITQLVSNIGTKGEIWSELKAIYNYKPLWFDILTNDIQQSLYHFLRD